jgi:SpoVK/Ycf46/Vps4 family AAA+-type ATPase
VLAAYCESVAKQAKKKLLDAPETVALPQRKYTLREKVPPAQTPLMVGLDSEYETIRKSLRQMFLYDPRTNTNPEKDRFADSFLLCGPPGTGKSTIIRALLAEGERCSQLSGTPFRFASYDASNFSSYFGQSTRIIKKLLVRTRSSSGVGLFVIEDADMILQSRDEQHKSHGVQEVQQYFMNELSGLRPNYGNSLTILTTNKVSNLDDAIQSRAQRVIYVNPFTQIETHEAFWSARAQHLNRKEISAAARASFESEFAGRDLDAVIKSAINRTTAEPSDEEISSRSRMKPCAEPKLVDYERAIAERRAALHTRAS